MTRLCQRYACVFMKSAALSIAVVSLACGLTSAQETPTFPKEQIAAGAELYAVNCAPCHGARMQDPGAAFNLRKFPPDQH